MEKAEIVIIHFATNVCALLVLISYEGASRLERKRTLVLKMHEKHLHVPENFNGSRNQRSKRKLELIDEI